MMASMRRSSIPTVRNLALLLLALLMLVTGFAGSIASSPAHAQTPPREEMRAFWIDSSNPGFHNRAQVDELINNVLRAGANTIIPQMRRHGDSWYNNSLEPRAAQASLAPADQFDPLAYLIERAHAHGIKVHAWFVVSVVCRRSDPLYGHPGHVCTHHGPDTRGTQRWTTETYNGTQVGDFDFGHPGTLVYFEQVVQHLVRNYPEVDGVHLDYIRYGDQAYGYNQVSLDRFQRFHGLPQNYRPLPNDPLWSQWRRDQVTDMVRRIYIRSKAIKPTIEVSVAAITWGGAGSYSADDWPNSAAYRRVYQDWRAWLQEGIIDFALPMKYFAEGNPQQRGWYNSWLNWGRNNFGRRAIVVGTGAWLNNDGEEIAQLQRALTPDAQGRVYAGTALYSYNQPMAGSSFERRRQFMDQLRQTVFAEPAQPPRWPWVYNATHGHLQGIAAVDGEIVSDSRVSLIKDGQWVRDVRTSYDGWYGAVDLEPGWYQVLVRHPVFNTEAMYDVLVEAGKVTNGP